ncbi:PEP-CTERM sorting domain-containing protein [Roseateles sp.]|uniref:PEP-CTERM sorting domain-containing protein n=1 Tax=Roseateles sp. TaxID=1971397 RepID=UPI0025F977E3|nr:PEP-CTERM sorting domain-containing protein [Roseateles sp.]MBV8034468.1 PEP-CTERM sorting domain-containing protein [Roseateles sp.]
MRSFTRIAAIWGFAAAAIALSTPAQAGLTLTAAGTSNGFSLSTFANFSSITGGGCCGGPFGIAVSGGGNVLVSVSGTRYVFNNADGQVPGSALGTTGSSSSTSAYARAGGLAYGADGGHFVQFKDNGTVDHVLTGVSPGPYLGMWGAPNGHIIATSGAGLIDIDPLAAGGAGSFRVINGAFGDGVTVSPDGLTAYLEQSGGIQGYSIATGAPVGPFISVPGSSADGTGMIIGGALNGDLIINNNNGDVDLWNFGSSVMTKLATGASPFGADRGDYVAIDTKGCLFLDEGNHVDRLCLAGASIGEPNGNTVPEPVSAVLVGAALLGLGAARRRRF